MSKQFFAFVFAGIAILLAPVLFGSTTLAQDAPRDRDMSASEDPSDEKVFNLIIGGDDAEEIVEEEEDQPRFEPRIEPGEFALTLTLGYFGLSGDLLEHSNLIYKATDDEYFFGDIKLKADAAFNPILRLGYDVTSWLGLEGQLGMTFVEYNADITNPRSVDPVNPGNPEDVAEMGDFDAEHRSAVISISNVNALIYPLSFNNDGSGRWHPYLTGGVGYAYYSLDSDYIEGGSGALSFNGGFGMKLIGDDLISLRIEALYQIHTIDFEPGEVFRERDAGTVITGVLEFDNTGHASQVEDYASNSLGGLTWQMGFTVGF